MIPWIESHTYSIGPLVLQTWGTFVAAGFLVATWLAARRARSRGLDPKHAWDMAFWIFIAAMVGARAFHVLFYDPGYYILHPWEAVDPRKPGYASMGGLLATAAVFLWYVRWKRLDWKAYADAFIWGVPWGYGIGRIGCFLGHLHPGTLTSFALGVRYPDGQTRHDLGLYLSIFGFLVGLAFLVLDRKKRRAGFFLGAFLVIDGAGRFLLDFLRIGDVRAYGLTPAQWVLIGTTAIGVWMLRRNRIA